MTLKIPDQKLNREDIISAVAHLIAEQGLENLTMRNIARQVGCSVGTLPHYFEGKDDIVIAALNWSSERILKRISAMAPNEIHLENLYPLLSASMPIDEQSDTEWRVRLCLWDYAVTNEEMRKSANLMADSAMELLTHLVNYLQVNKQINSHTDHKIVALSIYQMCIGAGFGMLHTPMDARETQLLPLFNYIESMRV